MNIAIIGGGTRCSDLMDLIEKLEFEAISPKIVAVADHDDGASGLVKAKTKGLPSRGRKKWNTDGTPPRTQPIPITTHGMLPQITNPRMRMAYPSARSGLALMCFRARNRKIPAFRNVNAMQTAQNHLVMIVKKPLSSFRQRCGCTAGKAAGLLLLQEP